MKRLSDAKAMQINGGGIVEKAKELWNNSVFGKLQKKVQKRNEMLSSLG